MSPHGPHPPGCTHGGCGAQGEVVLNVRQLDSNPALPSCNYVALDQLLNPSGKQFSHLPNGGGNSSYLAGVGVSSGLNR